ncbi:MAG: hypothetical protein RIQ33_1740 [Bacteroidota bacterium]
MRKIIFNVLVLFFAIALQAKPNKHFRVIGYYCGSSIPVDSFEVEKLTHIIFSFGHLKGNLFHINSKADSLTIQRMVEMKKRNPDLKVMLTIGGWSGCPTCSDVFNSEIGRREFAQSVKTNLQFFKADGIDLDWEYPVIKGFPGHTFRKDDKQNFTLLVKELRNILGKKYEISFAAGGFTTYIDSSIEWEEVKKYVDFINVMSYDLVHGYSKLTGHHTPLFSTPQQIESTDNAVKMLMDKGVSNSQIVIGAAFYGRLFLMEQNSKTDLYQPATFYHSISSKIYDDSIYHVASGFVLKWDSIAQAPYAINEDRKLFFTYENEESVQAKTTYAINKRLGGIMFWQLYDDKLRDGLLNKIDESKIK